MHLATLLLSFIFTICNAFNFALSCAPNNGIMTTPTYGTAGALFAVCAQITISSPPGPIFDVLLDFPSYSTWNTFVYSVDLPSGVSSASKVYVGMPMTFHTSGLIPDFNTTSMERVTFLEQSENPPFVAWREDGGYLGALMQAEHVSLLVDQGNGETLYVSWETYYGITAPLLLLLKDNLTKEFGDQATDLKKRVESLNGGS